LLATLVAHGAEGIGIDISRPMLRLAQRRLAARDHSAACWLVQADIRQFALREPCGGAFCPVGSFGHLTTFDDAARHLRAMRRALAPGATYAVQQRLQPIRDTPARLPNAHSSWQFEHAGERLSYAWFGRGIDARSARETQVSRIERLSGPRSGEVIETEHVMRIWDWRSWCELLRSERFEQRAALDPGAGFRPLPLDESLHEHPVAWHLLVAR
jgi:SAM-dependent methyltransferase